MAAPQYVGTGVVEQDSGALTVNWPTHLTDDIGLLFVESANEVVSTPAGWASIAAPGTGTGGAAAATRLSVFWKRAASAAEAAVAVSDSGTRQTAFIMGFRGCIATGDPYDVTANDTGASSASVSIPGATTTVDECLVVAAMSNSQAIAATTVRPATLANASLSTLTERENTQLAGTGGAGATRPLPVGVFSYANGIGNGPGNDASGSKWGALHFAPSPATIATAIADADTNNVLLILSLAGNKNAWKDTNGNYDEARYASQLDRFVYPGGSVTEAEANIIADAITRQRVVVYLVDEPNREADGIITPAQVAQMAALVKARWSDAIVIVRVTPTLLASGWAGFSMPANGYPKIDYAWSQYNNTHGRTGVLPSVLWAAERAIITSANLNMGLCVSLNLWAGGIAVNTDGIAACWDYDDTGLTSGYIKGDREGAAQTDVVTCGNLASPAPSLVANPNWILHFATEVEEDGAIPFCLYWNHATGSTSSEFNTLYLRADFVTAFDDAIDHCAASEAPAWRTPK
jgi:hypothetical protein